MKATPLTFVTGKGGVGKSTVAAALAYSLAQSGKRTLLAELGETSYYQNWLGAPVQHEPRPIFVSNLYVCRWEAQRCLKEYLLHYLKVESLVNLFFENKVMKSLVQAAPALTEIALLGKITSGIRKIGPALDYDCIVIDCFATGHFKALMSAPVGLASAVRFGPMGEQSRSIHNVIANSDCAQYWIVTLAEELPLQEALELKTYVQKELDAKPQVVLNRTIDLPQGCDDLQPIDGPFFDYIKAIGQRQKSAESVLDKDVIRLPQIWATEPESVLVKMAESLERDV